MKCFKGVGFSLIAGALFLISGAHSVFAAPIDVNLAAYYIPSTYTDTVFKTNTTVIGGYGYFGFGTSVLECGYDQILDTQRQGSVQQNYPGIYTYYLSTMRFKAGYVAIRPNGGVGNGDVGIASVGYDQYNQYGYKEWSAGVDAFGSLYRGATTLKVYQATPFATFYLGSPWGVGWFDLTGKVNGIFTSDDDRTLYSQEVALKYNFHPFSLSGTYYMGEASYGVHNGGFVVVNTNDKMQGGYGISGAYALGSFSFTLNYQYQNLTPPGTTVQSSSTKIGGLASYHF